MRNLLSNEFWLCKDCGGKGLTESIETIEVVVPPCKAHGSTITFSKMGYDSKDKHGQTGDLHFIVNYNIDKNKYAINGRDVYELIEIPYYDCILGKEITRKLPSGKEVTFNINGVFYNRLTDSGGVAKLNIRLMAGQYIITSSYNGCNIANKITIMG